MVFRTCQIYQDSRFGGVFRETGGRWEGGEVSPAILVVVEGDRSAGEVKIPGRMFPVEDFYFEDRTCLVWLWSPPF